MISVREKTSKCFSSLFYRLMWNKNTLKWISFELDAQEKYIWVFKYNMIFYCFIWPIYVYVSLFELLSLIKSS